MSEQIGSKILKLRMRQGLTQAQLAKGICDRSHISMIEAGRCTPSIVLLEKLATRLNLTLPDLLGEVTPPSREASYSFDLLIDHITSLLESRQYVDGCVLIRKYLRHPDIVESPSKLAQLYRYAGILEAMKKEYDRAESNLQKAKEFAEQCRDQQILLEVNISLGALQNVSEKFKESEVIYNKALSHAPKELPLSTQIKLHYGLGLALQGQGKIQQALRILKAHFEQLLKNNSMFLFGEIAALIAYCYEKLNTYKEAIPYYEKVAAYHTFKGNTKQATLTFQKIADCYNALGNIEEFNTYQRMAQNAISTILVPHADGQEMFFSSLAF